MAINLAAGLHGWKQARRNLKCLQECRIPLQRFQVQELCAAGVGDVRNVHSAVGAAGQIPDNEGINRSEEQFARCGFLPCARNVVQQPANFQAAEIRAQRKSGRLTEPVLAAACRIARNSVRHPCVLPDNCVRNRFAGFLFPDHGSLALIGDSHCCNLTS